MLAVIITAAVLAAILLLAAYICYRLTFSVPAPNAENSFSLPASEQYEPYKESAAEMMKTALSVPYEPVSVKSFDGLSLCGKLYFNSPDAPLQIMLHGYRSSAERDFCGSLAEGIKRGFNVLTVDQRAHGKSEGSCLSFGINERYDCISWINYSIERFGADVKLLLYGMSMGAATVLMAAGLSLPKNVVGIIADCGYSSPRDIIRAVIAERHYPLFPTYMLVRLGGRLFGGFDIEAASATAAMAVCKTPVLFIHGEEDRFVPCNMGRENYSSCAADNKRLLTVPLAGHGISYMVDKTAYLNAVDSFLDSVL